MRTTLVLLTLALLPAACGGTSEDEGGGPVQDAPAAATATPADMAEVGGLLDEAGWSCGEPLVDMAGYDKVVCGIPDELMEPGMATNAVGVHGWSEQAHVEVFREQYLREDAVLVVGDGWFLTAPTQASAEEAASVLEG